MKRGKRIAFTVAATGLALILGLGILHLDHFQPWWYQATRTTREFNPVPWWRELEKGPVTETKERALERLKVNPPAPWVFQYIADRSGIPVIVAGAMGAQQYGYSETTMAPLTRDDVIGKLRQAGWLIFEQRVPQRAYVVMRADGARQ
jgi:hypothetical protein